MNHEKWEKLPDDEKRIKVAELCDITEIDLVDPGLCDICDIGKWFGKQHGMRVEVLDYCYDLNGTHQAWLTLDDSQRLRFMINLATVFHGYSCDYRLAQCHCEDVIGASAAQRAEAFVLTKEPE